MSNALLSSTTNGNVYSERSGATKFKIGTRALSYGGHTSYNRPKKAAFAHTRIEKKPSVHQVTQVERVINACIKKLEKDHQATGFFRDLTSCEEYLQVIGLGVDAIPYLLKDLRDSGRHWYVALRAITRTDVGVDVPPGKLKALAAAWIAWGEEHGHL